MATFNSETNVVKMSYDYFLNIKDHFTESRDNFDKEMYIFINQTKDQFDINSNWEIQLPMMPVKMRHRLHTFERYGSVVFYSLGNSVQGQRIMIITPEKKYIDHIFTTYKPKEDPVKQLKQRNLEKLINEEFAIFKEKLLLLCLEQL